MGDTQSSPVHAQRPRITTQRPYAVSSADTHKDIFDYRLNTSHVDPATGNVLPKVNPLSQIPRHVRSGKIQQVLFRQSHDPRGDADHRVGASFQDQNANPRAWGAFDDKQRLAHIYDKDRFVPIPIHKLPTRV